MVYKAVGVKNDVLLVRWLIREGGFVGALNP